RDAGRGLLPRVRRHVDVEGLGGLVLERERVRRPGLRRLVDLHARRARKGEPARHLRGVRRLVRPRDHGATDGPGPNTHGGDSLDTYQLHSQTIASCTSPDLAGENPERTRSMRSAAYSVAP